jgi:hypothetical protein
MKYSVSNYKNFEVIFVERKLKLKKKLRDFNY